MLVLLTPLLYTGPIPPFQLPPFSEWSSVDYTLYLPLLSHSLAASLQPCQARARALSILGIHA